MQGWRYRLAIGRQEARMMLNQSPEKYVDTVLRPHLATLFMQFIGTGSTDSLIDGLAVYDLVYFPGVEGMRGYEMAKQAIISGLVDGQGTVILQYKLMEIATMFGFGVSMILATGLDAPNLPQRLIRHLEDYPMSQLVPALIPDGVIQTIVHEASNHPILSEWFSTQRLAA